MFLRILIFIYRCLINLIYLLFKLLPTNKNKIFFLSRQTNKPSIDYRMLIEEINKNYSNQKIVVLTKRIDKNIKDMILLNITLMIKQMYHLATSKVVIIDGYNMSISILKHKKKLKVIQIWHSLGAIKKFGYQTLNSKKKKNIAIALRMHRNYNYIISASSNSIPYFCEAFNYSNNFFKVYGLPRIDYILKRKELNKNKIIKKYPQFANKKVILYAPTFRDNNHYETKKLVDNINLDKYILIIKNHEKIHTSSCKIKGVYYVPEFTSLQLLSIIDYIITDYSAISIEAAIANIPIFIYAYDFEEYNKITGINIDLKKEFPGYVFDNAEELARALDKKYDLKIITNYKNKYVRFTDGTVTKKLTKFIVEGQR